MRRGDWLVSPGLHAPTDAVEAIVTAAPGRTLKHNSRVHVHVGAAAISARVLVLGSRDQDGVRVEFIGLSLARPTAILYDDRIVLRDEATGRVIAGGRILEPFRPEQRASRTARVAVLSAQRNRGTERALTELLAIQGWLSLERFARARNIPLGRVENLAAGVSLCLGPAGSRFLVEAATLQNIRSSLIDQLAEWHNLRPELAGLGKPALLSAITRIAPMEIGEAAITALLAEGKFVQQGATLRLATHDATLAESDLKLWPLMELHFDQARLRPPRVREWSQLLDLSLDATESLLHRLENFGHVIRVTNNRYYLPRSIQEIADCALRAAAKTPDKRFSPVEFNREVSIGRNLAIQVLEFFDGIGFTRREGSVRRVRSSDAAIF